MSEINHPEKHESELKRALGFRLFTPLYDTFIRLLLREQSWRSMLVRQADLVNAHKILDVGCGTGTLLLHIKDQFPNVNAFGVDGDVEILAIAHRKAAQQATEVSLTNSLSTTLPYSDNAFDRVLCSLMLHHLTYEQKLQTAREAHRVLRPGGHFHVADWGVPQNALMRLAFFSVQLSDEKTTIY